MDGSESQIWAWMGLEWKDDESNNPRNPRNPILSTQFLYIEKLNKNNGLSGLSGLSEEEYISETNNISSGHIRRLD